MHAVCVWVGDVVCCRYL